MFGHDIIFSCCDIALFLCRDDVAIEVSMSRSRRSRQEVRCCIFHVATSLALARVSLLRQSLIKVGSFYSAIEFGLGQGFYVATKCFYEVIELVKAISFYVATEFGLGQGFYVATKCFYATTEFGQDQEFLCCDIKTELAKVKRIYITTKYFCVATEFALGWGFYVVTEHSYVEIEPR